MRIMITRHEKRRSAKVTNSNIRKVELENHNDFFKHMILNIYIRVLRPRQLLSEILLRIIIDFYFHRILFRDYFRNPTTSNYCSTFTFAPHSRRH